MIPSSVIRSLAHRLIVSCQAPKDDPFRTPEFMALFAVAAAAGGAGGIRANSPEDVRAIRQLTRLPIIGLRKRIQPDGKTVITPSFADASDLVEAGADIVAVECTIRGQRCGALERMQRIQSELAVPVIADIATIAEAVAAAEAGADLIASTMRGYTEETASVTAFESNFIAALVSRLTVPVVAEGRIQSPSEAAEAIAAGAHAVIVGTAITRPEAITARFVHAIERVGKRSASTRYVLGIDLGGTNTKAGIVSSDGRLQSEFVTPTPACAGRRLLLRHLAGVARRGLQVAETCGLQVDVIGIATAGWVDPGTGRVAWATSNLEEWAGTPVADELHAATGLRVVVENDANAVAVAERYFGVGRDVDNFVCLTLGTGVGGSCYNAGQLVRGAHSLANAVGHIIVQYNGITCSCGLKGCLEAYTNAEALLRYSGPGFHNAESVIRAAHAGNSNAVEALRTFAGYLAAGIASIAHVLDPELVILGGGLAQDNELLFTYLDRDLKGMLFAATARRVQVRPSSFGYYGGVLGAAAVALEGFGSHVAKVSG
jgi:N-acetylmannosamine-6-phosphate 2-epimerase / N-acetylmannosamine kinase